MAKNNMNLILGGIVLILGMLAYFTIIAPTPTQTIIQPDGAPTITGAGSEEFCGLSTPLIVKHQENNVVTGAIIGTTSAYLWDSNGLVWDADLTDLETRTDMEYGGVYTFLVTKADYSSAYLKNVKMPCSSPTKIVTSTIVGLDTSMTDTVLDSTYTANANSSNEMDLASSGAINLYLKLDGATSKEYMVSPTFNKYIVLLKAGTESEYDYNEWSLSGCNPTTTGQVYAGANKAFLCECTTPGCVYDFGTEQRTIHIQALAGVEPTDGNDITYKVYGWDYYINTLTNKVVETGGVENNVGSAVHTIIAEGVIYN